MDDSRRRTSGGPTTPGDTPERVARAGSLGAGHVSSRGSTKTSPDVFDKTASQQERITKLDGEFKGLRAQFTEFAKRTVSQHHITAMREDIQNLRAEILGVTSASHDLRQSQQALDQMRKAMEQQSGAMHQELLRMRSQVEPLQGMQQEQARLQQEQALLRRSLEEATQHFKSLQGLSQEYAQLKQMSEETSQRLQNLQSLSQDHARLRQTSEDAAKKLQSLQTLPQEFAQLHRSLQALQGNSDRVAEAKREVEKIRQEHARMQQEHSGFRQRNEEAVQKLQAMQQEAAQSKHIAEEAQHNLESLRQEVRSVKNENQGAKGHLREQLAHMRSLEEKTRGLDELGRLRATVDTTGFEFWNLKKQLYDSGVLAPKKEPEPEQVPVGTLELGEDCFTARLLMRLGLMKAQLDASTEARALGNEVDELASDDSSEVLMSTKVGLVEGFETDVTGIQPPEIDPDGPGHAYVTVGWIAICCTTLLIQALIVVIMIMYGIEAGDDCITENDLTIWKWYMLHVSKAVATIAAGILMCKELMDIVNYWMVSELLESGHSIEVAVSAIFRMILIVFIAMANVILFMTMTSPADVWINMTALGFIGELGGAVLDVARRGVFGHHISKAVTSVNFSLNFMTDYPWWFVYARSIALTVATIFIVVFAFVLYVMPDNVCMANGESTASNLLVRVMEALHIV